MIDPATPTLAAFGLALLLPALLAWYFEVYVNWKQKVYPIALSALGAGVVLQSLCTLRALGEDRPLALAWKTALSLVVFMAMFNGVTGVIKKKLRRSVRVAATAALSLAAAQVIVLHALLLYRYHMTLGGAGFALAGAVMALALGGAVVYMWNTSRDRPYLTREGLEKDRPAPGRTAVHVLYTGSSDAILLESEGRYALVDAGNTNETTRRYVLDYVKRVAGGRLEFILATHAHHDHIGGFEQLILDPDVAIGRAYIRPPMEYRRSFYNKGKKKSKGPEGPTLLGKVLAALNARGVPVIHEIPEEAFALGALAVTLFGGGYAGKLPYDENDCSIGLLAEGRGQRAFLAGDMNNYGGREARLAPIIGKVDLVKAPHHGGEGSSSKRFVKTLRPGVVVSTGGGNVKVQARYKKAGAQQLLYTGDFGGIAAVFGENGIACYALEERVIA